jgi:RNA-directed DNA polymerase
MTAALRRLFARLRFRVNEAESVVVPATQRKFQGFSFWVAQGRTVKRRVARNPLGA